jgi:hypothetical protein
MGHSSGSASDSEGRHVVTAAGTVAGKSRQGSFGIMLFGPMTG